MQMEITSDFGSIQVIVPHEDDELLLTAGVLHKAAEVGLDANVVVVTNGDYDFNTQSDGIKRLPETLRGLALIGIGAEAVSFLGYPDTGMPEEEAFLSRLYACTDGRQVLEGHCSRETYSTPEAPEVHFVRCAEHAQYCRDNVEFDLYACLVRDMPQNIFTTSPYDTHGDHSGLYAFVIDAVKTIRRTNQIYTPRIFSGIVHSRAGDENWPLLGKPNDAYTMPNGFEASCPLKWADRVSFEVPKKMREEPLSKNLKHKAISKHKTALKPDAIDFMYSFVKREEIFWLISLEEYK